MKYRIAIMLLCVVGSCLDAAAQNCPTISIGLPIGIVQPKIPATFTASISSSGSHSDLKFFWGAGLGVITADYRSPTMTLLTDRKQGGENIAVFVRVEGLPEGCPSIASEIVAVGMVPEVDPADEFGALSANEVKARIDNFYVGIQSDGSFSGMIEMSFGKAETKIRRIERIKRILSAVSFRRYDISKISFALTCSDDVATRLSIVAAGSDINEQLPNAIFVKGPDMLKSSSRALERLRCKCSE
jgi:hypothetical protein